jgi:uncharacterized protein (TIGR03437 family)
MAILKGSNFKGTDVSVTFDGLAATMIAADGQSITVQLPVSLKSGITSQAQVSVDGVKSALLAVPISELSPAIFAGGVLNADSSVNGATNAASVGGGLQIFATGLFASVPGPVTVKLHDRTLTPTYTGLVQGEPGINQVNVMIPDDLPAMTTFVQVCGFSQVQNQPVCSLPADITLQ